MKFNQGFEQIELNGKWQFTYSSHTFNARTINDITESFLPVYFSNVPGNFELDLLSNNIISDPYFGSAIKDLRKFEKVFICYFRTFDFYFKAACDPYLIFEGLDCIADIFINGIKVISTDNMMIEHCIECSNYLKEGKNEITVFITPPGVEALKYDYPIAVSGFHANYESLYIRKPAHMFGWDILPRIISAGIFRPVYIEQRTKTRFLEVYLQTSSINENSADCVFFYKCLFDKQPTDIWSIRVTGNCNENTFSEEFILSFQYGKHFFSIDNPRLWQIRGRGNPSIYKIKAQLLKNNDSQAIVEFTHGIRTIELLRKGFENPEESEDFVFLVNGEKIFAKGTNWVAADALHSRDKKRIPAILEMAADINCNMLRCWGGNLYEDDIFYEICDSEGILVWQDFAMACAIYPQDKSFQSRLHTEAKAVIMRLRQHPCLALWAGDNECDQAYSWFGYNSDPNKNFLTRSILPEAVRQNDPFRSYLPSSPYIDSYSFKKKNKFLPEDHLWGLRDYFKSDYYAKSKCKFASEMGYHGCPSPESIKKFISKECLWPYDNEEWLLHSTSPLPEIDKRYNFRVELMANQIKVLFGNIPENLKDFSYASQVSQGEAIKFFIELFRCGTLKRTGILWWNLMDGWPQFSDAVVDYYFNRKLAYEYIKRSQRDIILAFSEPEEDKLSLILCNDNRTDCQIEYSVVDAESGITVANGNSQSKGDSRSTIAKIDYNPQMKNLYIIRWRDNLGSGINHYLSGTPPFDLNWYKSNIAKMNS